MGSTVTLCLFPIAGPWLLPGTSSLCAPATPHPQFGGTLPLSPAHSCERYPAMRTHRPAPYPSPYAAHRNNSPSKLGAWGRLEAVRMGQESICRDNGAQETHHGRAGGHGAQAWKTLATESAPWLGWELSELELEPADDST